ncbi:hypothetical protein AAG570_004326 [Ranatra chinensis]|uniref:Uncharacterized protein n=1 Tax=Ranatra chinensis TaxID=642074 RepID=A0ABD0YFA3_9HEMI
MASKRRNMFHKNKTKETTEKGRLVGRQVGNRACPVRLSVLLREHVSIGTFKWATVKEQPQKVKVGHNLHHEIALAGANIIGGKNQLLGDDIFRCKDAGWLP